MINDVPNPQTSKPKDRHGLPLVLSSKPLSLLDYVSLIKKMDLVALVNNGDQAHVHLSYGNAPAAVFSPGSNSTTSKVVGRPFTPENVGVSTLHDFAGKDTFMLTAAENTTAYLSLPFPRPTEALLIPGPIAFCKNDFYKCIAANNISGVESIENKLLRSINDPVFRELLSFATRLDRAFEGLVQGFIREPNNNATLVIPFTKVDTSMAVCLFNIIKNTYDGVVKRWLSQSAVPDSRDKRLAVFSPTEAVVNLVGATAQPYLLTGDLTGTWDYASGILTTSLNSYQTGFGVNVFVLCDDRDVDAISKFEVPAMHLHAVVNGLDQSLYWEGDFYKNFFVRRDPLTTPNPYGEDFWVALCSVLGSGSPVKFAFDGNGVQMPIYRGSGAATNFMLPQFSEVGTSDIRIVKGYSLGAWIRASKTVLGPSFNSSLVKWSLGVLEPHNDTTQGQSAPAIFKALLVAYAKLFGVSKTAVLSADSLGDINLTSLSAFMKSMMPYHQTTSKWTEQIVAGTNLFRFNSPFRPVNGISEPTRSADVFALFGSGPGGSSAPPAN